MKKIYLSIILFAVALSTAFSQVPNTFNYQAVVRNAAGEIITNKTVSFRISLLKDTEMGTVLYSETHTLSTNDFGLVNLKIGEGTKLSGNFSPGNWGDIIFTKVEIDPEGGSSFSHLATTKLSSVPYAFMAQTVVDDKVDDADADPANELQTLSLNGTLLELSNGGGQVTLPTSGGGGDNWGAQTVNTDGTLTGDGTSGSPLSVVADGDGDDSNELQTLSINASNLTLSDGGGTVTLPTSPWSETTSQIKYVGNKSVYIADGSGFGLKTKSAKRSPLPKLEISTGNKTALDIYSESSLYSGVKVWNEEGTAAIFSSNNGSKPVAIFDHVDGGLAAQFSGAVQIKDGTQGAGKVLTSDGDGIASWQTPAAGGSSLWTESGSNVYRASGNVGIGTTSPSKSIDIQVSSATLGLKASSTNAIIYLDRKSSAYYGYTLYRTNGVNKFYVGLLGDDNYKINYGGSSGLTGLEVTPDGNVNMSDDLNVEGEVHTSTTGTTNNMLPFAYGTVDLNANKIGCTSNVGTVTRTATGQYKIEIANLGSDYSVMVTVSGGAYVNAATAAKNTSYFLVNTWDTKNDEYKSATFSFVVYKP